MSSSPCGLRKTSRTRVAAWCLALLGALPVLMQPPSLAGAQTPNAKITAQKRAREGRHLAELGQHDKALVLFRQAYEAQADPGYLYNIATELQTLGRDVEAIDAFDRFLRDAQGIAPEFIADAHQQRKDLRQRLGELGIHCNQDDARVSVDNEDRGVTPKDQPLYVTPGSHRITLTKDGFQPWTTTVVATKGSHAFVEATLQSLHGASPDTSAARPPGGAAPSTSSEQPAAAPGTLPPAEGSASPPLETPADASQTTATSSARAHIAILSGATFWSGVTNDPQPSAHVGFAAGYAIVRFAPGFDLRIGVKGGFTLLSETSGQDLFLSALVDPMLVYEVVPNRLRLFVDVGAGVLVMSGVRGGSVLLTQSAGSVTGALTTFELHPSAGLAYAIAPWCSVFASPGVAFSPRPNAYFQNPSTLRIEASGGFMFHL